MKEVLLEQLPLLVASICLIGGLLIGRELVKYANVARFWPIGAVLLGLSFFYGNQLSVLLVSGLLGVTDAMVAKYISIGLLSFLSGALYALLLSGNSAKKKED